MQTPSQTLPLTTPANDHRTGTLYCLGATTLFSLLFILSLSSTSQPPSPPPSPDPFLFPNRRSQSKRIVFLDQKLPSDSSSPTPPSIAYLISGSANDSNRILRLLFAVYHPRNYYLLHLNRSASQHDRYLLALTLQSIPVFRAAQNVNVIGKADFTYAKGSSSLSSTLHGASLLLRISTNWDWFINLSAEDYPLVTQDDLLHILSYLPKDFNFVKHTSQIGWRESRKLKPIIVDPAFYLSEENQIYYATQTRKLPDAYRLFTNAGSSSSILSRKFIEFCVFGTDNLPRTLLLYLYAIFDGKNEPRPLEIGDFDDLVKSGAAFATTFFPNDPVLDDIDQELLGRSPGKPVPGGWCLGDPKNDTCAVWGNADILRPGPGSRRLEKCIVALLSNGTFQSQQCVVD